MLADSCVLNRHPTLAAELMEVLYFSISGHLFNVSHVCNFNEYIWLLDSDGDGNLVA